MCSLHLHNEEEISKLRDMANYMSEHGCHHDVVIWAMVAGSSHSDEDIERFLRIIQDFPDNPFREGALVIAIMCMTETDNIIEARKLAAELGSLEKETLHVWVRARMARDTNDAEDVRIAVEVLRDLVDVQKANKRF